MKRCRDQDPLRTHLNRGAPAKRRRICTLSRAVPPTKQHQLEPTPFHAASRSSNELKAKIKYHMRRYNKRKIMQRMQLNATTNNDPCTSQNLGGHDDDHCGKYSGGHDGVGGHDDNNDVGGSHGDDDDVGGSHDDEDDVGGSHDDDDDDDDDDVGGGHDDDAKQPSTSQTDPPIFTIAQLAMLCESDMRTKENSLRTQYEQALSCRLADQYEDFLKFNSDVMSWGVGEVAASYVS